MNRLPLEAEAQTDQRWIGAVGLHLLDADHLDAATTERAPDAQDGSPLQQLAHRHEHAQCVQRQRQLDRNSAKDPYREEVESRRQPRDAGADLVGASPWHLERPDQHLRSPCRRLRKRQRIQPFHMSAAEAVTPTVATPCTSRVAVGGPFFRGLYSMSASASARNATVA